MSTLLEIRGVKCLVQDNQGRFLLVKISYAHKQWTLPGGGVDESESFEQAAVRELKEETGVELPTLKFFAEYEGTKPHKHPVRCFYGKAGSTEVTAQASEIEAIGWFPINNLPANRSNRVDDIIEFFTTSELATTL
ncbi:hypothetical protein A3C20_01845 [Candidatus Kaiserbacteria bacterium RIFCSPHIGHO2_02_FULL_55_25]|uniref:Nudix hydrolase domain-containing protein n=1 Tax=Candidatus Kaiserbacteria bacterium RIFCSPHIGHO2_02_FULL_55_25 TaxID=1798498 RepID=A0A1F6E9P3_9BACT|nr:MAG: hypothetical protein A2764_00830 [Candidatus Kaiserbacteria bacterium RIFCSPHIGHO2_01_FULL_55_79]OGG70386.1 MAG: hypothetical protein A3C20_01845 [Candidatus Kaiserbacteria bacterium RIFCSPHIGHO2_02_FULL_55_25]OGG78690.1 MAG: hypothetical protein A3F56_01420 [Candidatus Kaiserbacteria bacterium RIFCSPHIGHO2_12_FULL_55_13]OGG84112.1 MAG: hypothetical protein A3A42_04785 [Candidatus Kaiserbacteria bacterium RIFCSPLOWO2_01_FULL_55_25]